MTNKDLKPCPFCGNEEIVLRDVSGGAKCMCLSCKNRTDYYGNIRAAKKAWNTRAAESVDVEALKMPEELEPSYRQMYKKGWNDCIDHLADQGYLKQPQDNSEALEALDNLAEHGGAKRFKKTIETIRKALRGE